MTTTTVATEDGITLKHTTAGIGLNGDSEREHWSVGREFDGAWHGTRHYTERGAEFAYAQRRTRSRRDKIATAMYALEGLASTIASQRETLAYLKQHGKRGKRGGLVGTDRKTADRCLALIANAEADEPHTRKVHDDLVVRLTNAVGHERAEQILLERPTRGSATAEILEPLGPDATAEPVFADKITRGGKTYYATGETSTSLQSGRAVAKYSPLEQDLWFEADGTYSHAD